MAFPCQSTAPSLARVEMLTFVPKGDERYLVRTRVRLEGTTQIKVFPFEIRQINGPTIWRTPSVDFALPMAEPLNDLTAANEAVRKWAARFISKEN
jgi:hypothetical protein